MKNIKSPINYTGNKYRLLEQIQPHFPKKTRVFVDLFCGGATVGFNANADKIILIDNNKYVIGLLKYLAEQDYDKLKTRLEKIIDKYNLSYSARDTYKFYKNQTGEIGNNGLKKYNQDGFYVMRADYNALKNKFTSKSMDLLYMLMVYGFNNDIRFNTKEEYNLPVGKTDLNQNNLNKLKDYIDRAKTINYEFICGDFKDKEVQNAIKKADFVYADPPYLITDAVYNESGGWTEVDEVKLLELLTSLKNQGKKFVLSNVVSKRNAENVILDNWIKTEPNLKMISLEYNYSSSSYNKIDRYCGEKEIIVEVDNDNNQ